MRSMRFLWVPLIATLAGCGGVFESTLPSPQAYVLRLPSSAGAQPAAAATIAPLLVQRPEAGPGLDSNGIALLRDDRRFDFYAASRWAAPAPDLLESVVVEGLRRTGAFNAVFEDGSPFAPAYNLRITLRRFEADYSASGNAPTVHVVMDCTVGRHRDRQLLASFVASGSAVANEDRLGAVVAAFETATAAAVAEIQRVTTTTLGGATP
jgi:cholesterol transport system auxiliary component